MKETIRSSLLQKRNALTKQERIDKSHQIFEQLRPYLALSDCVGVYKSFGSEVITDEIIKYLWEHKKIVAVPKCEDAATMQFYQIDEHTKFQKSTMGIEEPCDGILIMPSQFNLMIIPMVGYDKLHRLGYGKGYYDRYLTSCSAYKIGIAYAMQEHSFPISEFDMNMDIIITESKV